MSVRTLLAFGAAIAAGIAAPAHADPCEGRLPTQAGTSFTGEVRYVGDGDSLCVGRTPDPRRWVEVRLADFNAPELHAAHGPEAKAALESIALRRAVTCVTERGRGGRVISYDRVIARCALGKTSLGELLRRARIAEGGN